MERLNWAVLGLIGIVTALGLGTSSGAGKTKIDEQSVAVAAASNKPSCSACCNHASATQSVAATKPAADEACAGNCAETGVCCDKSLPKSETVASATTFAHDTKIVCPGACSEQAKQQVAQAEKNLEALVQAKGPYVSDKDLDQAIGPLSSRLIEQYTPLPSAADAIANLTKQYVCEGGECLTKPGQGSLVITAVEPATEKPEGLLNLLAAAEQTEANHAEAAKTESGTAANTITITSTDLGLSKSGKGTLTLQLDADTKLGDAKAALAKITAPQATVDHSRAAARAAKLAKLEEKMAQPWTLAFNETPLPQAAAAVQEKYGVPVLLDRKALEEAAIDLGTPLTADQQPEIEAGEFLRGYLRNHDLTWMIPASNDRILITSLQAMEQTLINRVYDATDLVDENQGAEDIIERIQALVGPTTWKANGGQGDLTVWQKGNRVSLICSNTYWAQRAIATLLEDLRTVQQSEEKQTLGKIEDQSSVLRRYDLPGIAHIEDAADRQKEIQLQRDFLLALCKDIEGFDPTIFQAAVYGTEMLVTKQTPAVHRKLQQTLKLVTPAYPCGGGFGGGAAGGALGN